MLSSPKKPEIDSNTIKLLIGLIALTLANITSMFAAHEITSISASYHEGGWARNYFVGFLFAISAFMLAYNGVSRKEMLLSKGRHLRRLALRCFRVDVAITRKLFHMFTISPQPLCLRYYPTFAICSVTEQPAKGILRQ